MELEVRKIELVWVCENNEELSMAPKKILIIFKNKQKRETSGRLVKTGSLRYKKNTSGT